MLNKLSRKDIDLLNILAQTTESKNALDEYIEQHEKAVRAYKAYCESVVAEVKVPNVEKTANELRAEVIQRAKEFVEKYKYATVKRGRCWYAVGSSFVVNSEKRTITALIKGLTIIQLRFEGIAKCSPDDVFNEHIGKAIALGRALGKDVSEFESAPQPTEPVIGHKLSNELEEGIDEVTVIEGVRMFVNNTGKFWNKYTLARGVTKIIDDTNARYKN